MEWEQKQYTFFIIAVLGYQQDKITLMQVTQLF